MTAKVLVIGAGQFGTALVMRLVELGVEVTVIDANRERVDRVAPKVVRAIVADASDPRVLESLDPASFDVAVGAIGEENLEASIFSAALLCQLGVTRIIARTVSQLHGKILTSLGVHEVYHPEDRLAEYLAMRLANPSIVNRLQMEGDVELLECELPETWVGRSLKNLDLRARFHINVVGVRRPTGSALSGFDPTPDPDAPLNRGDVLMVVGAQKSVEGLMKEIGK